MLINFNHLKTFYNALKQKIKDSRGNWNQNDPAADDYIKNRTHYSEGMQEVVVLQYEVDTDAGSATPMDSAGPETYQVLFNPPANLQSFNVGQKYTVTWNGVTYTCIAKEFGGIPTLGDPELIDGVATNKPFCLAIASAEITGTTAMGMIVTTQAGKYPITVATRQEVVHKLDKKYLPDDLTEGFADVAKTGSYNDLSDTPALATVATSGSYNDLSHKPTIYTDVVRTGSRQSLSTTQKQQARNNIGAADANDIPQNVVQYTTQFLTKAQQTIARNNIGASDFNNLTEVPDSLLHYIELTKPSAQISDRYGIASNGLVSIAFGASELWRTTDGISWEQVLSLPSLIPSRSWSRIFHAGDYFFLVSNPCHQIAYSSDGLTWATSNTSSGNGTEICGIAYGDGKYVAVCDQDKGAYYSEDGINWTFCLFPESSLTYKCTSICYGNGRFVAVGYRSALRQLYIFYSIDGITWEIISLTSNGSIKSVAYGNNVFVALGDYECFYSIDGITWENKGELLNGDHIDKVLFHNGAFYALGGMGSLSDGVLYTSIDGLDWTYVRSMPILYGYGFGLFNNNMLIIYEAGDRLPYYISQDGKVWQNQVISNNTHTVTTSDIANTMREHLHLADEDIPDTIARVATTYTKTETDTQIQSAINSAGHLKREIVTTLPSASAADANTIYMVKDTSVTSGDAYKEYMLINGTMTQIGDTSVNLNGYVNTADFPGMVKVIKVDNATHADAATIASQDEFGRFITDTYATKTEVQNAGLPAVTAANNGQFLQVVNGAWAAATIPSAEGVTFGE